MREFEKLLTKVERDAIYAELMQAEDVLDGRTARTRDTYEEGVVAAIQWMLGNTNTKPMTEE